MIVTALRPVSIQGMHNRGDVFELPDYEARRLIDRGFVEEYKTDFKNMKAKDEPVEVPEIPKKVSKYPINKRNKNVR